MTYWQEKKPAEFSAEEWEKLCDGCGRCCLWKFEDEDSGEILYTDIACEFFDASNCSCTVYPRRFELVARCMDIPAMSDEQISWLPPTCAYRLLHEGRPLFDWHPLISGERESVHKAGISMRGRSRSARGLSEEEIVAHIINPDATDAEA